MKSGYLSEFKPALFSLLKHGYGVKNLTSDMISGLIVAIIALPLSMAFAIASGASPEKGLYTAIIGGFLISFFGGSRYQIGGPAGAFIVIIYGIIYRQGIDGLLIAGIMAGLILILMGLLKLGTVIKFIPYPVTKGFSAGIAIIIFVTQLNDFFGMGIKKVPAEFFEKLVEYSKHIGNINLSATIVGLVSILIIVYSKKITMKIPGPFLAVVFGVAAIYLLKLPIETIQDRFGSIPSGLPTPTFPNITMDKIKALIPDAITIAVLGAIESLLSAVVADGMTGDKHRSNMELVAQGIANIASPLFGGIPATGTIARTATNIKNGAYSPLSGIFHAIWVLLFMLLLSPVIVKIPFATLGGILIVVAYNMSELEHIKNLFKAPKSDIAVFLTTFLLTVIVDLNVAVQLGMLLSVLLFMRRMISLTAVNKLNITLDVAEDSMDDGMDDKDAIANKVVPKDVEIYELSGPFFFGVADKVKSVLTSLEAYPKVFILRMRYVPMIDATGMHALTEICSEYKKHGTNVILSGVSPYVKKLLIQGRIHKIIGEENIVDHIDKALSIAKKYVEQR
ncbi:sulfate permease [Deferribacterales bacterium Es71-Z0220]|uniref:SulP family inorganic anion transporter n=1 Tax=Deferrivibrio essentukiensis TaxID=2880922 RepID=UPI001F6256CC|nr:sulfate permease [Deferrivibrio essentukiensis]MCB4205198.1 sulfate permease [Deferrivibrio essentukiensis]